MIKTLIRSTRTYLWPLILANSATFTYSLGGSLREGALLGTSLCLLASYGFLLNDLRDRTVDLINDAHRLESADAKTLRAGRHLAGLLVLLGIGVGLALSPSAALFSAGVALGLVLYTTTLRSVPCVATVLAATLSLSPLLGPLLLFDGNPAGFHLSLLGGAWTILIGREIFLDIKDINGDRFGGRTTLPILLGESWSSTIGMAFCTVGSSALAFAAALSTPPVAGAAASLAALSVLFALVRFGSKPDREAIESFIFHTRIGMLFLAASAYLFGSGT